MGNDKWICLERPPFPSQDVKFEKQDYILWDEGRVAEISATIKDLKDSRIVIAIMPLKFTSLTPEETSWILENDCKLPQT